ncbi:MAG: glutamate 5-kinase [Clostridia bacterium]|jgi:glutamate 5-kinase|nr:glutamate 5-kinase [Clostridia bacterium]NLF36386.1 glutamate 5-kinase [Clostridiaceae bacterium]MDD3970532.1 glutamate 5-kinase [Clostridia bacterium]MDD4543426.1 glutamate 5-kinase [Clostridia bacterium]HPJ76098.1 glutamate 5-kinase [Clostridia bacterium]
MRTKLKNVQTIVIKVGTNTLTHSNGKMNLKSMEKLVREISELSNEGKKVILVTSGAVGVGLGKLNLAKKPKTLAARQVLASVGQCELMHIYSKLFSEYGITVGQILLTRDVTENPAKAENAYNTFKGLLDMGIVPIVNENDAISTDQLAIVDTFGDNDTLSAMVAKLVEADLLIILSNIDGLYDKDPNQNQDAHIIETVTDVDDEIQSYASDLISSLGKGGMKTKLSAAKTCMENNIIMAIINGQNMKNISRLIDGENIGTLFMKKK